MRRMAGAAVVALLLAGLVGRGQAQTQTQTSKPLDYEAYCKLPDAEAKRAAWMAAASEIRGQLVRTQLERWRDANISRLDAKQKEILEAVLKSITSDTYADGPKGEEARTKSRELITDLERLFAKEDLMAMQPNAPCIPKK